MLAHAGQPAMHQHAYVPFLVSRDLADLLVCKAFTPQVDCLTLRRRQMFDQLPQACREFACVGQVGRIIVATGRLLFTAGMRFFQRFLAAGLTQVIERPVATNAEQPGGQPIRAATPFGVPQGVPPGSGRATRAGENALSRLLSATNAKRDADAAVGVAG